MVVRPTIMAALGIALVVTLAACRSTPTATRSTPTTTTAATSTTPATPSAATTTSATTPAATGAAGASPDPCVLVAPADVKAALGGSAGTPTDMPAGVYRACIYLGGKVVVLVRSIDKATFDKSAAANPGGVTPISGVGQDAYSNSDTLLVWQNGTEISLLVTSDNALAAEKQLATAAVGRLPTAG